MEGWLLEHAAGIRIGSVLAAFLLFGLLEAARPRRAATRAKGARWFTNLTLLGASVLVARLLVPAGAVGAALLARDGSFGLLHQVSAPSALEWCATLVLLDLAIWLQHLAMHRVPLLWRLHLVHHADEDLDTSSGVRFHPIEIVLSLVWKVAVVTALGAPVGAVLVYEVLLSTFAVATHANIGLPTSIERGVRLIFITPDVHRVHHSVRRDESMSNFGTITSAWDHLFRTFRSAPSERQVALPLGLGGEDPVPAQTLGEALRAPFTR